MRWSLGLVAALILGGIVTWTCRSAAQSATPRSTDVAGGATHPHHQNTDIAVVFDESAADLPQAAIRAAIERELGMPPDHTVLAAQRELMIGVDGRELVVRLDAPDGRAERRVTQPDDAGQIPELLRLIAGNLARDQRALLEPAASTPSPPPPVTSRGTSVTAVANPSVAPAVPRFRHHWLGLHFAQDFLYGPSSTVCDTLPGQDAAYSCFYSGTAGLYVPNEYSSHRAVDAGLHFATTRLLASYDYALSPALTLGGRAGVAFGGAPTEHWDTPNGRVAGKSFFPGHLEARLTWWFLPLTRDRFRAFAGIGGGMMQIDAMAEVKTTCGLAQYETTDGCPSLYPRPNGSFDAPTRVDAWRRGGRGFASVRAGTEIRIWNELGLELDVNFIATFPTVGGALEPSFGLVYGL